MATTPVFLPGEFHGQRSLVGYSSWGLKESGQDGHNGQDRMTNNTLKQTDSANHKTRQMTLIMLIQYISITDFFNVNLIFQGLAWWSTGVFPRQGAEV